MPINILYLNPTYIPRWEKNISTTNGCFSLILFLPGMLGMCPQVFKENYKHVLWYEFKENRAGGGGGQEKSETYVAIVLILQIES